MSHTHRPDSSEQSATALRRAQTTKEVLSVKTNLSKTSRGPTPQPNAVTPSEHTPQRFNLTLSLKVIEETTRALYKKAAADVRAVSEEINLLKLKIKVKENYKTLYQSQIDVCKQKEKMTEKFKDNNGAEFYQSTSIGHLLRSIDEVTNRAKEFQDKVEFLETHRLKDLQSLLEERESDWVRSIMASTVKSYVCSICLEHCVKFFGCTKAQVYDVSYFSCGHAFHTSCAKKLPNVKPVTDTHSRSRCCPNCRITEGHTELISTKAHRPSRETLPAGPPHPPSNPTTSNPTGNTTYVSGNPSADPIVIEN